MADKYKLKREATNHEVEVESEVRARTFLSRGYVQTGGPKLKPEGETSGTSAAKSETAK